MSQASLSDATTSNNIGFAGVAYTATVTAFSSNANVPVPFIIDHSSNTLSFNPYSTIVGAERTIKVEVLNSSVSVVTSENITFNGINGPLYEVQNLLPGSYTLKVTPVGSGAYTFGVNNIELKKYNWTFNKTSGDLLANDD